MLANYFRVAWRNLLHHRLYSAINIAGLAIGLTCVIFVVLFVRDQLSYDEWIPGTQNLYRLEFTIQEPGRSPIPLAMTPFPMAAAMRDAVPGVTGMTRLVSQAMTLGSGSRQFSQLVEEVDPDFFQIIRLPFVSGRPDTAFREPQSVVLSASAAKKYFGNADPVGRLLTFSTAGCGNLDAHCGSKAILLKVTGVLKDLPRNTQLSGDVFIPNTSVASGTAITEHDWLNESSWSYVTLAPGVGPATVVARMASVLDQDATPPLRQYGLAIRGSQAYRVHLTRFTQVHLSSGRWQANMAAPGSWATIYGVAAVGALILLTACFNFMNLATALAVVRAREIALRKLLGARRLQLVAQFLGEAVLTALLSLALAVAAAEMLLPLFDRFLGESMALHAGNDGVLLFALVVIAILTGLVSGSYPALVLSGFRPAGALRASGPRQAHHAGMRNALVLFQFAVSIGLGIVAGVVFGQISYARRIDLGFRHADVIVVGNGRLEGRRLDAFADALRGNAGVVSVGFSSVVPFEPGRTVSLVGIPGRPDVTVFNTVIAGPNYPVTYGIPLLAGRLLSASRGDDRLDSVAVGTGGDAGNEDRNVLLNATAALRLGFTPDEAVGRTIVYNHNHVQIVGVLADAKVGGARQPVAPTVYTYIPNYPMTVSVRVRPGSIPETLSFIDRTWHSFVPTVAIMRYFLEEPFETLYWGEDRQGTLFGVFVVIAILIGCLGLYGLAVFSAERRAKEIGIRKISGARTGDIVGLMLWRISVPVLVANVIAWPVAYLYLRHWLEGFAYRIALDPLYFLAAGAAALLIAGATVLAHTLRLAHTHPVQALRYE